MKKKYVILNELEPEIINFSIQNGDVAKYLEDIDKFDNEFKKEDIYKTVINLSKTNKVFQTYIDEIDVFFSKKELKLPIARKFYLALLVMPVDYYDKKIEPLVDGATVKNRLVVLMKNKGFNFLVADKDISEKIFEEKLLSMTATRELYGEKSPDVRHEFVLAGGDASRFLLVYEALAHLLKDVDAFKNKIIIDKESLSYLQEHYLYKKISSFFEKDKLEVILNRVPIVAFAKAKGVVTEIRKNKENYFFREDVENIVDIVLREFKNIPKAMIYMLSFDSLGGTPKYFNYFSVKLLRFIVSVLKSDNDSVNKLYFMVQDRFQIEVLQNAVNELFKRRLIDSKKISVLFMDRPPSAIPVAFEDGRLIINSEEDGDVFMSSTGHGPAYVIAANEVLAENEGKEVAFSVQTVDNCGTIIYDYTALQQRAATYEAHFRDEIVNLLTNYTYDNNENLRKEELEDLFNRYDEDIAKYDFKKMPPTAIVAKLLDLRWDHRLDAGKKLTNEQFVEKRNLGCEDIAFKIKNLPVTIAMVVEPEKGQTGGGLHNEKGTRNVEIVDAVNMSEKQKKEHNFKTYFNPMLFSTHVKIPMNLADMEENALFIEDKTQGVIKYNQAASTSTHLATRAEKVLKRVVFVELAEMSSLFKQNKTIDETSADFLNELHVQVKEDIEYLAKYLKKHDPDYSGNYSVESIAQAFYYVTEKARKELHKKYYLDHYVVEKRNKKTEEVNK